jgi:hypothetical protein
MAWDKVISEVKGILSDIKLSLFFLLLAGILLFMPDSWANSFSLHQFRSDYKNWIALAFLAFLCINVIHTFTWIVEQYRSKKLVQLRHKLLYQLSADEKAALSRFIHEGNKTAYFDVSSGVINGLEAHNIVWRSSSISEHLMMFAYNIQPWAWEYLHSHPECLR